MEDMKNCEQTKGMSVLQHGESVWAYTQKLIKKEWEDFKIPDWLSQNFEEITSNLHDLDTMREYNVLHDCGKPYCLQIDPDGRRHFPDHARVSKETYSRLPDSNPIAADLIGWDMVLHVSTAEEIKEIGLSKKDAYTLLITALAEIHSNANMFGGIESISFKSKWKKLERRGKMLIKEGLR